jgi:hypothetical protein
MVIKSIVGQFAIVIGMLSSLQGAELPEGKQTGADNVSIKEVIFPDSATRYSCYEITLHADGTIKNPFDPDEVEVSAAFISPSGNKIVQDGFWYQPFKMSDGKEIENGKASFKIRYCPVEKGEYSCIVRIRTKESADSVSEQFTVSDSSSRGFVRKSSVNPQYFCFDDKTTYFPVGQNVCWAKNMGDFNSYLEKMASAGENYIRIWMHTFTNFAIEGNCYGNDYPKAGRYNLKHAWRLDSAIELAGEKGLYIQLCFENSGGLKTDEGWKYHPYNSAWGGVCENPEEFFTSDSAKSLFRKRLKYIVARYSAYTAVMAWEFFNEMNRLKNLTPGMAAEWQGEMGEYLKSIDPYRHLVTNSFHTPIDIQECESQDTLDFLQPHYYGIDEYRIPSIAEDKVRKYGKPVFLGEAGAHGEIPENAKDKNGVYLHNQLWLSIFGNSAGTAMPWWWDCYVHPNNFYSFFLPLSQFVKDIDFANMKYTPASARLYAGAKRYYRTQMLLCGTRSSWQDGPSNTPQEITIDLKGEISGNENLSGYLHGVGSNPVWHNPVTFIADYKYDSYFTVLVGNVSKGGSKMSISIDGRTVLDKEFTIDEPNPEGKYNTSKYNGKYTVDIPKGKHKIIVDNQGNDWVNLSYQTTVFSEKPPLKAYAMMDKNVKGPGPVAFAIVCNKDYVYFNCVSSEKPSPIEAIKDITIELDGFLDGGYSAVWTDTITGKVLKEAKLSSRNGKLAIPVPAVDKIVACKVYRLP